MLNPVSVIQISKTFHQHNCYHCADGQPPIIRISKTTTPLAGWSAPATLYRSNRLICPETEVLLSCESDGGFGKGFRKPEGRETEAGDRQVIGRGECCIIPPFKCLPPITITSKHTCRPPFRPCCYQSICAVTACSPEFSGFAENTLEICGVTYS